VAVLPQIRIENTGGEEGQVFIFAVSLTLLINRALSGPPQRRHRIEIVRGKRFPASLLGDWKNGRATCHH